MSQIKLSIATLILLFWLTPSWAENIHDCAKAGGTVCSDSDVPTAGPADFSYPTGQDECNAKCSALAASIESSMSNEWVCTATSATFTDFTQDPHGNWVTHCECDITCVKGVLPRKDAVIHEPIDGVPVEGDR